jgi:hypothetical protein
MQIVRRCKRFLELAEQEYALTPNRFEFEINSLTDLQIGRRFSKSAAMTIDGVEKAFLA